MPATAWIHRTRAHAHAHGNVREHDGEHERPFLAKLSVFSGVSRLQRLLACARAWYQSSAISVTFRTLSRVSRGDLWKVPREGTFNSTVRPSKGRCSPVAARASQGWGWAPQGWGTKVGFSGLGHKSGASQGWDEKGAVRVATKTKGFARAQRRARVRLARRSA